MMISVTFTASQNGIIRHKNTIPWENFNELRCDEFTRASCSRLLVLGRHSFEALKIKLECDLLVLSTTKTTSEGSIHFAASLAEAMEIGRAGGYQEMVISGGRQLLIEAMLLADVIYKSTILVEPMGNVYAPTIPTNFQLIWVRNYKGNPSHSYQTYTLDPYTKSKLSSTGLLKL
ncbi:dihydrofolate reductase [Rouxiella sp. T17]|uniref:dihydrofolate reductase n=1 Tax=Rouxiella sp. T17 TaxID=3085684 RepID=UPI002FC88115